MVRHNMKKHEHLGQFFIFLGATWTGLGLYGTFLAANRLLVPNMPLISGRELLLFPLFFGLGALLWHHGTIELREALPGKNR